MSDPAVEAAHRALGDDVVELDMYRHQPVLSMEDGRIMGCQCMDRVFYKDHEDWGSHLAEVCEPRMTDAAREALKPIRELHKPMHAVFSWSEGLRLYAPCSVCGGKAGVHPCGCWGESDTEFSCPSCRDEKGRLINWPCETAKLIYTTEELES